MRRVLFQSKLVGNGLEFEAVKAAAATLGEKMDPDVESVRIATKVHESAYKAVKSDDPYHEMKIDADRIASPFGDVLEHKVAISDDPLRTALLGAVAGNIMDLGQGYMDDPEYFSEIYNKVAGEGLAVDDIPLMEQILAKSEGVVYILDNCGESQLDLVVMRQLKRMGKRVVAVARGRPILNDVTLEDAYRIGMDNVADKILTTGKFYIGLDWDDIPEELNEEIERCGLIIAKGMANYEATSGRDVPVPLFHILRSKCNPVAKSLGVPLDVNVIKGVLPVRY